VSTSLIVLSGFSPKLNGLQWQSQTRLRIGKFAPDLDIVLDDPSVSRRHAEVFATGSDWLVRDLGSKNGTLVNGVRLSRPQLLCPEDVIQVGNMALKVGMQPPAVGAPRCPEPPNDHVPPASVEDTALLPGGSDGGGSADAPVVAVAAPAVRTAPPDARIRTSGAVLRVQAIAQHSWEEALQIVALDPGQRPRQGKSLLSLLRTGYHLSHVGSLDELLQAILDDAIHALDAQRGAIVLVDEPTGKLKLRAAQMPGRNEGSARVYSNTLAERCFRCGESLLCSDVSLDADLSRAGSVRRGSMASIICTLLRSPRRRLGVLHIDRGPFQEAFTRNDFYLADAIAASVAVGIECTQSAERQRDQFIQTITALVRTVEVRDQYTGNHTQRVTDYALRLAEKLGVSPQERQHIEIGTPLHDIGKIGIDDAILRKPGRLTTEEFEIMKQHTLKGAAILESIPALGPIIPIVRNHHERWDGGGYPDGLAQEQIARVARIVAVADAFDAMTSHRPYRRALSAEAAFTELKQKAGSHFDPDCVAAFLSLRADIEPRLLQQGEW
jgi:putative nucleotidyltransferase with HDIG domain